MKQSGNEYPLVSVAIITYNQKEYLRECIESILRQDYKNIEIVVADDGSSDGTQDMLRTYDKHYPGKFVLRLAEKNQGITANSNLAHFACSGKYIAWIGGDDLMLPEKISRQVRFMENKPDASICYHNLDVFHSDTNETLWLNNTKDTMFEGDIKICIRNGTFNGSSSNMVRRSDTPKNGFRELIPVGSDWLYWIDTLASHGRIYYIDSVLGRYRKHSDNITKKSDKINGGERDRLLSCQILITSYPEYFSDIMKIYSRTLLALRYKVPYIKIVWKSFCLSPNFESFIRIVTFLLSFGKIKL